MFTFLISGSAAALATGDSNDPTYNDKTVVEDLNFQATLNNEGKVEMSWDEYTPENFDYYKVVRSQDNQDPAYPDDGYIYVGQQGDTSYTDADAPAGTSYYRVCSIAKPERYCSPVVTIENGEGSNNEEEPTEETDPTDLAEITLTGSADQENGKFLLEWTVDDDSKITHGFKVAYSKTNEEPVYPGDSYHYLSDSSVRSDKITDAKVGYTYYIRVCQYDGNGTCLAYSNAISLKLEGEPTLYEDKEEVSKDEFTDTKTHWSKEYAGDLKSNCAVYGYKDASGEYTNEFKPDEPITRAELVKMLVQCKYGEVTGEAESFEDVDPSEWYAAAIAKAKKLGWTEGYDDGTFKPNSEVNRAEALKMILLSVYAEADIEGGYAEFSDVSNSDWFEKYVSFAVKLAYVDGYTDGSFGAGKDITRGEVAKIISKVQGY